MKAQRRHELKTNTLDKVLTGAPDATRKYAGMLLLVVLAAVAAYSLVRYRINSARESARVATENLSTARNYITQLGQLDFAPSYVAPPQTKAEFRKRWADDARTALDQVSQSANEPRLLAEALLAKGDLSWTLANLDELPGAATQPSLRVEGIQRELLDAAEDAYTQIGTLHPDQQASVIAAKFGLAAVAENRGEWDKAKAQYEAIVNDANAAEAFKTQARIRLEKAADWSTPVILAAATTQEAVPALPTAPPTTTSTPTTVPASAAATQAIEE